MKTLLAGSLASCFTVLAIAAFLPRCRAADVASSIAWEPLALTGNGGKTWPRLARRGPAEE